MLISFDPAIKLLGLKPWKCEYEKNNSGLDATSTIQGADAADKCFVGRSVLDQYLREN